MKTSTIASAKTNLTKLIYELDSEEAIHLTRHGRPVAVMLSEINYQKLLRKHDASMYSVIEQWRNELESDCAFNDSELKSLRETNAGREFSWDS